MFFLVSTLCIFFWISQNCWKKKPSSYHLNSTEAIVHVVHRLIFFCRYFNSVRCFAWLFHCNKFVGEIEWAYWWVDVPMCRCADVLFRFFCVWRKSYDKNNNTFNTPKRTILDACIKVFLICTGIVVRVVSFGGILCLQHGERANRLYCIPPICENISKTNN